MQKTVISCDYCSTEQRDDESGWIHLDIMLTQDGYLSPTTESGGQTTGDDGIFRTHLDYCPRCWPNLQPKYQKLINKRQGWLW